jgi:ABC-2 type transport system permease protein
MALALVVVGSAFFTMLSVTLAGVVLSRDRLMGIGQALTMPLFFASNALYPTHLMPGWLQAISTVNPLSYEVDGLRGVLLGTPNTLLLDCGVLIGALITAIWAAAALLPRLGR